MKKSWIWPLWSIRYHLTEWRVSWASDIRNLHSKVTSSRRFTNLGTLNLVICTALTKPSENDLVKNQNYDDHDQNNHIQIITYHYQNIINKRLESWNMWNMTESEKEFVFVYNLRLSVSSQLWGNLGRRICNYMLSF